MGWNHQPVFGAFIFSDFFDLEETFGPILSIFRVKGTGEEADREAQKGG